MTIGNVSRDRSDAFAIERLDCDDGPHLASLARGDFCIIQSICSAMGTSTKVVSGVARDQESVRLA